MPPSNDVDVFAHDLGFKVQRDFGDRSDRTHARLNYTIDDPGVEWFKDELASRLGWCLEEPRPYGFEHNSDRYG